MEIRPDDGGRERIAALVLGLGATVGTAVWAADVAKGSLIAVHAPLTTGSVLLGLPLAAYVWTQPADKTVVPQKWLHAGFAVAGFLGVNAGIGFAAKAHYDAGRSHLYSLHSWAGVACLVLLKGVLFDAFLAQLLRNWRFGGFDTRRHVNGALAAFGCGVVAILQGIAQQQTLINLPSLKGNVYSVRAFGANFIAIAVVFAAAAFVSSVRKRRWAGETRAKDADGREAEDVESSPTKNAQGGGMA